MVYRIKKEELNNYAIRKAVGFALLFLGMYCLLMLFIAQFATSQSGASGLIFGKIHWFLLIVLYMLIVRWNQNKNYAESMLFEINEEFVAAFLEEDRLNMFNQYAVRKNKNRYGSRASQIVSMNNVRKISIGKHSIKVKANDYNFFNGNGLVEIPKETEEFEKLKNYFSGLKDILGI